MTIRDTLTEYNQSLIEMLFKIFGINYNDSESFAFGLCPFGQNNIVMAHFSGSVITGELIFAIDKAASEHLLSSVVSRFDDAELKRHLLHSALEELIHIACLKLEKSPSFIKTFGEVHFQPPAVWDEFSEEQCIPLKHGISGELFCGRHKIQTFISCSEAHSIVVKIHDTSENAV